MNRYCVNLKICTEAEARRQSNDGEWTITLNELDAFLAIIYARGIYGASGRELDSLWSKEWGPPFFSSTMSRNRFREIMKYLRFDLRSSRSERLRDDKFALASEPWNRFIKNCITCFTPGQNITIDEQLFPTKARTPFTQYMPQKPDKFGIKFWLAVDVETKYLLNGFPYLGKDEQRPANETLAEHVVKRLMQPFINKGRNLTTDNFFTSLKLAKELRSKSTSLVGTINRARREIPLCLKNQRDELYATRVLQNDSATLTVYQGKKQKNVFLLSSMHSSVDVETTGKKLPETVAFYNATKYGVDVLDQMARKYSVRAASRRWPVQVFYNILDFAAINGWILYKTVTKSSISRSDFIFRLADELRLLYVGERVQPLHPQSPLLRENFAQRRQCQVLKCKNKTHDLCATCRKPVCGKCTGEVSRKCRLCC